LREGAGIATPAPRADGTLLAALDWTESRHRGSLRTQETTSMTNRFFAAALPFSLLMLASAGAHAEEPHAADHGDDHAEAHDESPGLLLGVPEVVPTRQAVGTENFHFAVTEDLVVRQSTVNGGFGPVHVTHIEVPDATGLEAGDTNSFVDIYWYEQGVPPETEETPTPGPELDALRAEATVQHMSVALGRALGVQWTSGNVSLAGESVAASSYNDDRYTTTLSGRAAAGGVLVVHTLFTSREHSAALSTALSTLSLGPVPAPVEDDAAEGTGAPSGEHEGDHADQPAGDHAGHDHDDHAGHDH
jgi:hypothetical protein